MSPVFSVLRFHGPQFRLTACPVWGRSYRDILTSENRVNHFYTKKRHPVSEIPLNSSVYKTKPAKWLIDYFCDASNSPFSFSCAFI